VEIAVAYTSFGIRQADFVTNFMTLETHHQQRNQNDACLNYVPIIK
jgi:hypothetical protein